MLWQRTSKLFLESFSIHNKHNTIRFVIFRNHRQFKCLKYIRAFTTVLERFILFSVSVLMIGCALKRFLSVFVVLCLFLFLEARRAFVLFSDINVVLKMLDKIIYMVVIIIVSYVLKQLLSETPNFVKFKSKFLLFYIWTSITAVILLPFFVFNPKNVKNSL